MVRHRLIPTALAALGVAAVAAPGAAHALTPVDDRVAFSANRIDSPSLTALSDGRALVGWSNGTNNGDTGFAMVRPAGAVFGTPQVIGTGFSHEGIAFAADPGTPQVFFNDGETRLPRRMRLEGDTFTGLATFGGINTPGRFPSLARCPDGTMVFAYQAGQGGGPFTVVTGRLTATGVPTGGTTSFAATSDPFMQPQAHCPANVPMVSFTVDDPDGAGAGTGSIRVQQLGAGGGAVLNRTLANGAAASSPVPRVGPDGRMFLTWDEFAAGTGKGFVATRAPGAGPAAGAPADFGADSSVGPVAFTPDGRGLLLLVREGAGPDPLSTTVLRTIPPGGATVDPAESPVEGPSRVRVRLLEGHPDGRPRVQLFRDDGSRAVRGLPQAGTTEPETPVLAGLDFGEMTWLASGDLLTVGVRRPATGNEDLVEGGLDTGAPPALPRVQVPARAVLGEPVELSVDAADPMGVREIAWTVDGVAATGPRVTHAFTAPGLRTVTIRATDRAGNATSTTRTVAVIDPNPPAPVVAGGGTPPVTTPAPALDRRAPALRLLSVVRGRKGAAARRVTVRLRVGERSAVDVELRGRLRRGGERGTLILASTRVRSARPNRTRTVRLRVPARLARLVGNRLTVRAIATDAAGNRRTRNAKVTRARR